jgi:hypothetical protein
MDTNEHELEDNAFPLELAVFEIENHANARLAKAHVNRAEW